MNDRKVLEITLEQILADQLGRISNIIVAKDERRDENEAIKLEQTICKDLGWPFGGPGLEGLHFAY